MEGGALEESLSELRQSFRAGRTRGVKWRKTQLTAIIDLINDNEEKIFRALYQDLGKHPAECYRDEIGIVLKSAKNSLSCIEKWMAPKKAHLPLLLYLSRGEILPEPLGLVLIISSWNFPISISLDPLIGAISAGNAVVLKPSEHAPACSSFLAQTLPQYLDCKAIKIIAGGSDVGEQLLQHKWDKIFYTGGPQIGRLVMAAAAKHLTPITLELGGKSPTILDTLTKPSDMKIAVRRIVSAKWGACSGQACLGVDYLLVEEKSSSTVIELLKKIIKRFYGENPANSESMAKIVNKHHFKRLQNLLKDPAVVASIVHGGSVDEGNLFIEPTILLDPPLHADIMTEEIFGPLLPIITLKNIQESIEFINSRSKPLTIYVFTKDDAFKKQVASETSSGSLIFNDTLVQFICDELPFGGVGQSGFGRYHGKFSFDAFSHEKAVMRNGFFPEIEPRYPPWNDFKFKFLRLAYSFDYLGLVLLMLGLKRP